MKRQPTVQNYPTYSNLPMDSSGPASLPVSPTSQSPFGGGRDNKQSQMGSRQPIKDHLLTSQDKDFHQRGSPDIVEKDSPPSSFQPASMTVQEHSGHGQVLRSKFAARPQGFSQSSDGYLQSPSAAVSDRPPQYESPRVTPHPHGPPSPFRAHPQHGSPTPHPPQNYPSPYHAGTGTGTQPHQVAAQTQSRGWGSGSYGNHPRPASAQVKYSEQESMSDILKEGQRLPGPLINHSPNLYNPKVLPGGGANHQGGVNKQRGGASHQGGGIRRGGDNHQRGGVNEQRGGANHQVERSDRSLRSTDMPAQGELSPKSEDTSVRLDAGIDDEMAQVVKVLKNSRPQSVSEDRKDVPFDPNLVCPYCQTPFRLGEIQKFKRHASTCPKK